MNEFMLYTLTYLFSQALGIYSIYKLVRAFFEECIVKRCVEVGAFVGYYVLTSSLYLIVNVPIANFVVNIISVFLLTFMYSSSIKKKTPCRCFDLHLYGWSRNAGCYPNRIH